MTNKRIHIFISGKVQGVFFRQALKVTARKNNVLGWVCNLSDGKVEAILEGDDTSVDIVSKWCNTGPANARVGKVDIQSETFTGEFSKFDVLY